MNYYIYFKGLASTPYEVGLMNKDTNEVVCCVSWDCKTSKEDRAKYTKYMSILKKKYGNLDSYNNQSNN
jgi:hypothetical protein